MPQTLPDSIAQLSQDHVNFRMVLNALERQNDALAKDRATDMDVLTGAVQYLGEYAARYHHPLEHQIYETLKARAPEKAHEVEKIESEHEHATAQLIQLTVMLRNMLLEIQLPRDKLTKSIKTLIEAERQHIRREEGKFFLYALEHLTREDWEDIDLSARKSVDPLFSGQHLARFNRLRDDIAAWDAESRIGI